MKAKKERIFSLSATKVISVNVVKTTPASSSIETKTKQIIEMEIMTQIFFLSFLLGSSLQYCFAVTFRRDNQRSYELRAESESDCKAWIQAVKQAR